MGRGGFLVEAEGGAARMRREAGPEAVGALPAEA